MRRGGFGRLIVLVGQLLGSLALRLAWVVRLLWARLGSRARLAVAIGVCIVIAAQTASIAPELSAVSEGLAVLLVAGIGLSMILTSPFRRL